MATTVNLRPLLDEGAWSGYQKLLVFGTAMTIVLDGADNQLLPNAVPTLMREWGRPRADFTGALALGPFGMMIGGVLGGVLGDRYGRRTALLGSVLTFAVMTLLIALVDTVFMLGLLRFLAGVGLGGAMPNAATLASEYVPLRQRPFAVTVTIVCIPLGGVLAGELAARIIPGYGWRGLFVVGGIVPLLLAVSLWRLLPESPYYLAGRRGRWPELTRMLRRSGRDVPDGIAYAEAGVEAGAVASTVDTAGTRPSMAALFSPPWRRDTSALFASFFFCLMAVYVGILLIPAMLTGAGFSQPAASRALSAWNLGGVGGAVLGALAIQRFGSKVMMLAMAAAAAAASLVMAGISLDPGNPVLLIAMFVLTGGLLNAVQTTMYALAAHVYPTGMRSTGVGAAVAVGRIGNVLAAYVGTFALARGGSNGYFTSWAVLMVLTLASLALIRRHIPRR